jgi:hypothetical protein
MRIRARIGSYFKLPAVTERDAGKSTPVAARDFQERLLEAGQMCRSQRFGSVPDQFGVGKQHRQYSAVLSQY